MKYSNKTPYLVLFIGIASILVIFISTFQRAYSFYASYITTGQFDIYGIAPYAMIDTGDNFRTKLQASYCSSSVASLLTSVYPDDNPDETPSYFDISAPGSPKKVYGWCYSDGGGDFYIGSEDNVPIYYNPNSSNMWRDFSVDYFQIDGIRWDKVTNMDNMFAGIYTDEFEIDDFNTKNVTTARNMFRGATIHNQYLNLGNMNLINLSYADNMLNLSSYYPLVAMRTPSNIKSGTTIKLYYNLAYQGTVYNSLNSTTPKSVTMGSPYSLFNPGPSVKPQIAKYANTVYSDCDGVSRLETCVRGVCNLQPSAVSNKVMINTSNSTTPIYLYSDGACTVYMYTAANDMQLNPDSTWMFSDYAGRLEWYNLENINAKSARNMQAMFGNSKAAAISVESWNTVWVTDMSYMFSTTSFYTTGYYPSNNAWGRNFTGWETIWVANMHSMFRNSSSSAFINLSGWHTNNLKDMSRMFEHARASGIITNGWNTYNVINAYNMFYYTNNLLHLNMYGWDLRNLSNATNMLSISSIRNFYSPGMIKAGINIVFPGTFKYGSTSYTRFNNTNATLRNKLFNKA